MVAMRDGVKLATDVWLPAGKPPFPVILLRTPYNKDAIPGTGGNASGYVVVVQDTRGRFASQGENLPFEGDGFADHFDGVDTLNWLATQPWCSGKIGTMGGSALGIAQLDMAGAGTNRLSAQYIQVASPSVYRYMVFPGGVFKKALVEDWVRATKYDERILQIWRQHPDYDTYWRARDVTLHWNRCNAPAIHMGGWYDIFTQGSIDSFLGYQLHGGPRARGNQKLIMGPWTHGLLQQQVGELRYLNSTAIPGHPDDVIRWFDHWLKGAANGAAELPTVTYYVMGDTSDAHAPGNVWRSAATWPPVPFRAAKLYLTAAHGLTAAAPRGSATLAYDYDPAKPTPTVGGPQLTLPAGPMDQRSVETRPDVLVFTSSRLDRALEVTGRVRARLWARSTAPDTDWMVKLCDVYPDGRSMNVCEGILRARFRDGFDHEVFMQPGRDYAFDIDLASTSIIFNKGHRLRVQVASSSSPGFDPNPNTGDPFRSSARTQVAHNTLRLAGSRACYIELPVAR